MLCILDAHIGRHISTVASIAARIRVRVNMVNMWCDVCKAIRTFYLLRNKYRCCRCRQEMRAAVVVTMPRK